MENHKIDARGKMCPLPVIEAKKYLETLSEGELLEVWVDNEIAVQNLTKLAEQKQLGITSKQEDHQTYQVFLTVVAKKEVNNQAMSQNEEQPKTIHPKGKTVVAIGSDVMGDGDVKLGHLLMKGFIYALTESETLPDTILLYNRGAILSAKSAESIADLKLLEAAGVEILTCGTCLNHYELADQLAVGGITNMYVIVEKQMEASKVIKP